MIPHIKKHSCGLWECAGNGLHSLARTPKESYQRWQRFRERMRDDS